MISSKENITSITQRYFAYSLTITLTLIVYPLFRGFSSPDPRNPSFNKPKLPRCRHSSYYGHHPTHNQLLQSYSKALFSIYPCNCNMFIQQLPIPASINTYRYDLERYHVFSRICFCKHKPWATCSLFDPESKDILLGICLCFSIHSLDHN